jgi:hypothetical protein
MTEDIRPEAAIRAAKRWLADVYSDESIAKIALEEVRFRDDGNWEITLGFNRIDPETPEAVAGVFAVFDKGRRSFKVVVVSGNDNHVMEMRDREVA